MPRTGEETVATQPDSQGTRAARVPFWRRRVPPFHPILAAAFPILAFYAANRNDMELLEIRRPLVVSLVATCIAWLIFGLAARSVRKGAVVASALVLTFFSYGHLSNLAPTPLKPLVLPASIAVVIAVVVLSLRARGRFFQVTRALNLAAIVLVAPSLATAYGQFASGNWKPLETGPTSVERHRVFPPSAPDAPDVYYIILDAHGRADRIKEFYGFDEAPFIDELRKRGFYVADRSYSNYDQTVLSLAASLGMNYLDGLAAKLGKGSKDTERSRQILDDNAVATFLRAKGYHYVFVGSGNGQVRNTAADVKLQLDHQLSTTEQNLLGMTALASVPEVRDNDYAVRRAYIREAFKFLRSVPHLPYAKFVFVHVAAPHPPFLFGPNGEARTPAYAGFGEDGSWLLQHITAEQYRDGYTSQLQYVDREVLATVDTILHESRVRPIIILQGDHGPRLHLDWNSLAGTDLREPFAILNAYLVPPGVRSALYPTITPVNTFRILLSRRFGGHYPPLPDRTYYSPIEQPYAFTDVTTRIPP